MYYKIIYAYVPNPLFFSPAGHPFPARYHFPAWFVTLILYPTSYWQVLCRSFLSLCHALVKSRIFLFYPMSCLPRVARPPFGVMLWQKKRELYPLCRHCEARKSSRRGTCPCFASLSSIVIARLGKAEYFESLRQIPPPLPRHCEAWESRSNPVWQ